MRQSARRVIHGWPWVRHGLTRIVGALYPCAVLLTMFYLLPELGICVSLGPLEAWVYPATQPLARVLIGVWRW
jgi:hypothetical protein